MKIKRILAWLILTAICLVIAIMVAYKITASAETTYETPNIIRCTVYDDLGYTASGQYVRDGIIAGKAEWMGSVAVLWEVNEDGTIGDFIGFYEFLDTGGEYIQNGERVDVWTSDPDGWVQEHGDYVYMQIIEGVG